jgi:hypothetical protein
MSRSYSQFDKEIGARLRNDLNHAEDHEDVLKAFRLALRDLLLATAGDELQFVESDIQLVPDTPPFFTLSESISGDAGYQSAEKDSDLLHFIERYAEAAAHRYAAMTGREAKLRTLQHRDH